MTAIKQTATLVIKALLEGSPMHLPVKIQRPDGSVIAAEFTGYYSPEHISIGYPHPEGFTHGILHQGDRLLTPIPSFEEWSAWKEKQ